MRPDDEAYLAFIKAAYAEAGWPVVRHWRDGSDFYLIIDPIPPNAVLWKVAALAEEAELDTLPICWPCYQIDQSPGAECPHDWRTAPQPTRAELART